MRRRWLVRLAALMAALAASAGCVEPRPGVATRLVWRVPQAEVASLQPGQSIEVVVQALAGDLPVDGVQLLVQPLSTALELGDGKPAVVLRTGWDPASGLSGAARVLVAVKEAAPYGEAILGASLVIWETPPDAGASDETDAATLVARLPLRVVHSAASLSLLGIPKAKVTLKLADQDASLFVQARDEKGRPVDGAEILAEVVGGEAGAVGLKTEDGFVFRSIHRTGRQDVDGLVVDGAAAWRIRVKDVQPPIQAEVRFSLARADGPSNTAQAGHFLIEITE